jgi:hypothetical protein
MPPARKRQERRRRGRSCLRSRLLSFYPQSDISLFAHPPPPPPSSFLWLQKPLPLSLLSRSRLPIGRAFNDLIDDFTKSDFKSFWDDFEIFKIMLKFGDLI